MRILTLNPPFLPKFSRESRSPAVTKSGTLYYPMWLAYATGYLEKAGNQLLFLDAPAAQINTSEVIQRAKPFQPQMVVIDTSTPSIYNDIEVGAALKQEFPDVFVVLVGVHVSALPQQTLNISDQIDAVAFGEYDQTLVDLASKLQEGHKDDKTLKSVAGLAFRSENGSIIKNEVRNYIENLDDIPFVSSVYKRHLDIKPYFYGHSRHPIVVIVTGRGCPFRCTYCVVPQTLQGHRYRKRSIDSIVQEFLYIRDTFPTVQEIMIEDDTLTTDKKRCRQLSEALIATGANKIPWSANSRAEVDYETMVLMRKANCRLFCVGFESGDQSILDNIKKSLSLDKIHGFMRDARRAGILIHGCFMVGNRGETRETLEKTLDLAKRINPDTAQFYPIMVYPGTEDYDYFEKKGWLVSKDFRKWITEEGLHSSVVSNPQLTYEELVKFCDRARHEFYLRPVYMFAKLKQMITHPGEARRIVKAAATFFKYLIKPSMKGSV
ncbi:radical SAM protein [Chitinispirillales bacterium ANBcel5]|uniref:B12-binding domain-containing radical SAM protein n=1 Tax=Cellulosispirillum alkaliphilum TaxID=3039283 RepID=UPI002A5015A5|nr:radical SAM protein [Chitinispirillales bacterium ANBcel5]